ncbi:MAG TPA: glycosyltransferase family A protein [Candidatus Moranbacteria bacterium]|nr:glycosyltransferase family A protein [Candidatus Moranbacteria bacterium]
METSIIIRTKNEEKWVGEVLKRLLEQTYKDFEIVIIDSGSTDKTLEIIKNYPVKLFKIKQEEFSFPFALNFGCRNAQAEKYFVFLSAHSLPISKTWLEDGINDFIEDEIMGVYGPVRALPDATFWEKVFFNGMLQNIIKIFRPKKIVKKEGMGVLGFTNAIIRKDLWKLYNLNESYGLGGEDMEWSGFWFEKGYKVIRDFNFSVYHSHNLGLMELIKQWRHWKKIFKPYPYKKLEYRK